MARKKNYEIKMARLNQGVDVICQYVSHDENSFVGRNFVMCRIENQEGPESGRLQMTPMLQFGARDSDATIPMRIVDVIFTPTDALGEEYMSVFVDETKDMNIEEGAVEDTVVEEETVEV